MVAQVCQQKGVEGRILLTYKYVKKSVNQQIISKLSGFYTVYTLYRLYTCGTILKRVKTRGI